MLTIRFATIRDSDTIADLHATSWLSTYRGILPDSYLDNGLFEERRKYWQTKMASLKDQDFVLIAEQEGNAIGFIAVLDRAEAGIDAFIDNLHVRPDLKGRGIGKKLMKAVAEKLIETNRSSVYLWVLNGNAAAEKFYLSRGAHIADTTTAKFGDAEVSQTRFVWSDLASLLAG